MPPLLLLAIKEAPEIIALFRENFQKRHPDEPVPTDAEIAAAFQQAFASSLAVDELWLSVHPAT
jgi:hypothetical protein